jgi:hypothetical protein
MWFQEPMVSGLNDTLIIFFIYLFFLQGMVYFKWLDKQSEQPALEHRKSQCSSWSSFVWSDVQSVHTE